MDKSRKTFLVFFGPPASGKGTQSDVLAKKLSIPVISPGELLRAEQDKGTTLGKAAAACMAEGRLVEDCIIEKIINHRLAKKDTAGGFILDGFPRNLAQYGLLKKKFDKVATDKDAVAGLYISCSDEEVKKRVSGRRVCDCGASYHKQYNPPRKANRCDLCGRKLEVREDDQPAVVRARLKRFHAQMEPLFSHFVSDYKLITIDGNNGIDRVEQDIWQKVKKLI